MIQRFTIVKDLSKNNVVIGESSDFFFSNLDYLSVEEKSNILDSSIKIIEKSVPPNFSHENKINNTGIIIGKIQSGKTLSFTSVIALAQDNDYTIVVVISGRTNLLLKQTKDRLKHDFSNQSKIKILNLKLDVNHQIKLLTKSLTNSEKKKLFIIPILKHQDHLKSISELFNTQEISLFLKKKTVLIIDDESDQASLNTFAKSNVKANLKSSTKVNKESAIFSAIKLLRHSCPNHTYLQYTATPQANLLLDTLCILSPDWHVLLKPGANYTGGNEFFSQDLNLPKLYDVIKKVGDYPPVTKHLKSPPQSYIDAIVEYLMLSALMSGYIPGTNIISKKASMLIHPTHIVNETKNSTVGIIKFEHWCHNIISQLESELDLAQQDSFIEIYKKLKTEFSNTQYFTSFPLLDDVLDVVEEYIIDQVYISRVTGGMLDKEEGYPWGESPYHILLGGTLLDRGFTVENLIMTYMPRDTQSSTNQSDTIEQRCRFYGYRKKYLAFCRVYLNSSLIKDYQDYNEFENFLLDYLSRNSLAEFNKTGSRILMSKNLIPTNMSRISDQLINTHLSKWQHFELQNLNLEENNEIIINYVDEIKIAFKELIPKDLNHRTKKNYLHNATLRPIEEISNLLKEYNTDFLEDKIKKEAIISYFEILTEFNNINDVWVIEIAPETARERTLTEEITSLGQKRFIMSSLMAGNAQFKNNGVASEYFGDRTLIKDTKLESSELFEYNDEPILQIHKINIGLDTDAKLMLNNKSLKGQFFYTFAFYFPEKYRRNYVQKINKTSNV